MESFFELAFPDTAFNLSGDTLVHCPFPHTDNHGNQYMESRPSMSIDIVKGIYHCFSCGKKGNELNFIKEFKQIDHEQAILLQKILNESNETLLDWKKIEDKLELNNDIVEMISDKYRIPKKIQKKLHIGLETAGRGIAFPVFLYGKLVDVISYNPDSDTKYKKRHHSQNGYIMPYDDWINNQKKNTLIVAGQKDLAAALTKNLNAITITGGEGTVPELFLNDFKNKNVFIVYDNDNQGVLGAKKVATALKPYTEHVHIVDISETCIEKGEDLWDYFNKYNKTRQDFVRLMRSSPQFTRAEYEKEKEKEYPTTTLSEAMKKENIGKILRSNIQVIANDENKFLMPTIVKAIKLGDSTEKDKLKTGNELFWTFSKHKPKDMFYLIDSNLKEYTIKENLKEIMGLKWEKGIAIKKLSNETVYKSTVIDYFETSNIDDTVTDFTAYSLGKELRSGNKYKITYSLVPHPQQGGTLTMVVFNVEDGQDSISNFVVTDSVKENLKLFQVPDYEDIGPTINSHIQKVKAFVQADYNDTIIEIIDFTYHTPLQMRLGNRIIRAFLDTILVSESRTGKSTTAEACQQIYGVANRVPLSGHNATIGGIIGGSHKTKGGYQVRAGLLPRSHKGMVIFEELQKASSKVLENITDVRTSGHATITRVSGTINMPALVRMLTLTNPKVYGAQPRPIASYPNGIEVLVDLVGKAEDIARYDIMAIIGDKGAQVIDPFFQPETPFSEEAYKDRIRWIWSRTPEQVNITKNIYAYAIERANNINKELNSYIKIFGTEAWLKILRLAIAIAGYVVSTDEDFKTIEVTKDHIDYAANYLIKLYDNPTFRLREFVQTERKYSQSTKDDVKILQDIWKSAPNIIITLENMSNVNQKMIESTSGLGSREDLNRQLGILASNYFIRYEGTTIIPTEKFRRTAKKIKRTVPDKSVVTIIR